MKFKDLISLANVGYPDDTLMAYYEQPKRNHGDTLAQFIVLELKDTFDPDASEEDQLREARRVLETAVNEIESVLSALDNPDRR